MLYLCTMNKKEVNELLDKYSLRKTAVRKEILGIFLTQNHALSYNGLQEAIGKNFDRVTVYRTLSSFEEKGLIHKVLDNSNAAKYALSVGEKSRPEVSNHPHFKCQDCQQTYCLSDEQLALPSLPNGFVMNKSHVLLEGICAQCN